MLRAHGVEAHRQVIAFVPPDVGVGRRLRAAPPPGGVEGLHERVGYFANLCVDPRPPPTPPDDDTATIMTKLGRMRWTALFGYIFVDAAKRATSGRLELRLYPDP